MSERKDFKDILTAWKGRWATEHRTETGTTYARIANRDMKEALWSLARTAITEEYTQTELNTGFKANQIARFCIREDVIWRMSAARFAESLHEARDGP